MQSSRFSTIGLFLLLLAFATSAGAKTWTVSVGGTTTYSDGYGGSYSTSVLAFSPANLTIDVGDSVEFHNLGGAAHNVHADDDSFRCAMGCDGDGQGGNGAPSSTGWTATVTFTKAGTVSFHCDNHMGMGMVGSIVVNSTTPPPIAISGRTSGSWYDPDQSGHGFVIQTYDPNIFLAIWFVFTPPPDTNQVWVYGQGTFDSTSNTTTIPAILLSGSSFPPSFNPGDVAQTTWGTMTFTFTDCNHGTVEWSSVVPGYGTKDSGDNNYSGTLPLTKIAGVSGYPCTQ